MSKSDISKEEFIRVGTTLYKLVEQPRLNGGYVKETHRVEQRDPAAGLRQGLSSAASPSMTASARVPEHIVHYRSDGRTSS